MRTLRLGVALLAVVCTGLGAQEERPTGLEVGALPAINFDADEGFGYGALAELYHYGDGTGAGPYRWTLQPIVFFTTEGRRQLEVFFDAPGVLADGWRLSGKVGAERQIANPYYGVGNETPYDPALEAGANPYYYRFGRERRIAEVTVQRWLGSAPVRVLVGLGASDVEVDLIPKDEGGTLLAGDLGGINPSGWTNLLRAGLVWDTRDRETGPRSGTWTEVVVSRADEQFGSDFSFTRWSFIDRRYVPLTPGLTFAHRYLVQGASPGIPVQDMFLLQGSLETDEGLGGAKTVRGLLKNRYVGRGFLVWNAELRWRAADLRLAGRDFHVVLSSFLDSGRVWRAQPRLSELLTDLHHGYGGGVRMVMGENFTAAVDAGTSAETGLQIYIGLGYLY